MTGSAVVVVAVVVDKGPHAACAGMQGTRRHRGGMAQCETLKLQGSLPTGEDGGQNTEPMTPPSPTG
ncbi:hypothetical protein CPLU01_01508 [Colletotrichum plurivorum]|uniref:Uncharacterized protein n=1 Tax=Colletotrichum plurivorum TaxID=2175906 RepID=A0A8H6NP16_9PEZI|nr:hypothetical protein CPLU01_01508 [Colletotrichum plurivorum]